MNTLKFSDYVCHREWADYGDRSPEPARTKVTNELPIDPIDAEVVMQELYRLPPLGIYHPKWEWQDIMEWGRDVGAIKLDISPLGSYKVITRRKIKDIQGETTWVCKKVIPLDETEHDNNEIALAHQIYESLEKISTEMIDSAKEGNWPDFEKFVDRMTTAVRKNHPSYCMFPVGVKKMNEDYYKIYFEFRGHGVEAPTRGRAEQFDIDILWDRQKGLIRCWGYDIDSDMSQHTWKPQPSEWDEWFAPSQPTDEIIESVVKIFMTY